MKKSLVVVISLLALSCSQKPEEVADTRLPPNFPVQGTISVERYSYGGAAGGYRYYVYGMSSDHERKLIYKGKSNKLLSLSFSENHSVLLDFCGSTPRPRTITELSDWQGLTVKRVC